MGYYLFLLQYNYELNLFRRTLFAFSANSLYLISTLPSLLNDTVIKYQVSMKNSKISLDNKIQTKNIKFLKLLPGVKRFRFYENFIGNKYSKLKLM